MGRLLSLSSNPMLRTFALDASQRAARKTAGFLMPDLEVPSIVGQYKEYTVKHRYKRPTTLYSPTARATRIGFDAKDKTYNLDPRALDFPIPHLEKLTLDELRNQVMFGMTILADAAELDREKEVIDQALTDAGAGTDYNFASSAVDPVEKFDDMILSIIKAAKNGADPAVVLGAGLWKVIKNHPLVRGRIGDVKRVKSVSMEEFSSMLFGSPEVQLSLMVEDTAVEGVENENINFLLDNSALVFARTANPTTFDSSYGKTFRLMGEWMKPGSYDQEDGRGEVLKMDWTGKPIATNTAAIDRINHVAA